MKRNRIDDYISRHRIRANLAGLAVGLVLSTGGFLRVSEEVNKFRAFLESNPNADKEVVRYESRKPLYYSIPCVVGIVFASYSCSNLLESRFKNKNQDFSVSSKQ